MLPFAFCVFPYLISIFDVFDELGEQKVGEVFAPHALPMYREERNSKKRKERSDRKDPIRSKKPDPPVSGGLYHITQITI